MKLIHFNFLILGAILAMLAVILGAFGAHGLSGKIPDQSLTSFHTAVRYQMFHALAAIIIGILLHFIDDRLIVLSGWCFVIGVILFSGSIYGLTTRSITNWNWITILGPITPIGGLIMIIGWILLITSLLRKKLGL